MTGKDGVFYAVLFGFGFLVGAMIVISIYLLFRFLLFFFGIERYVLLSRLGLFSPIGAYVEKINCLARSHFG